MRAEQAECAVLVLHEGEPENVRHHDAALVRQEVRLHPILRILVCGDDGQRDDKENAPHAASCSSVRPVKYEMYTGTSGKTHGEINDTTPATNTAPMEIADPLISGPVPT